MAIATTKMKFFFKETLIKLLFLMSAAAAAKSLQLCPTLCDPIDGSPPGFPVPGILQARTLEWVAISFSNAWKWKVKVKSLSRVWLLVTPWTAAHQAPPAMGLSRQEHRSGMPLPKCMEPVKAQETNRFLKKLITQGGRNIIPWKSHPLLARTSVLLG